MPSPGPAVHTTEEFVDISSPPRLFYPLLEIAYPRPSFDPNCHLYPLIFERTITPYDPDAFDHFLGKHDINSYPALTHNLRYGFPLGDHMPNLTSSNIIPNHPSILVHSEAIEGYLSEEVGAGRMSGPFSSKQIEGVLRGPFQSSPLVVAVQPQAPGEPDKIRICRHLSKATKHIPSVNSFISKGDFPTRFDTASRVADIVSVLIILWSFIPPIEAFSSSSFSAFLPHDHPLWSLISFGSLPTEVPPSRSLALRHVAVLLLIHRLIRNHILTICPSDRSRSHWNTSMHS